MNRNDLEKLWGEILRSPTPSIEQFERFAEQVVETFESGDNSFRQHLNDRLDRVTTSPGQRFEAEAFDLETARAFTADELGVKSWEELCDSVQDRSAEARPLLFRYAVAALGRGDFTALQNAVGGSEAVDDRIIEWFESGYFADEPETFAEAFAAACMLGQDKAATFLLDKGVDPYAGMKTGLSGFHYAASSAKLNVIKLLIHRRVPMEVESMYGSTVLGQALWSTVNENKSDHAAIVEALIDAGAVIEPGTLEWWDAQSVPSPGTKRRVRNALERAM